VILIAAAVVLAAPFIRGDRPTDLNPQRDSAKSVL